jgi:hypothetical protein
VHHRRVLQVRGRRRAPRALARGATADGRRLDRHGAARIVRRVTRRAGIVKHVSPTRCDMPSSPPLRTPACR